MKTYLARATGFAVMLICLTLVGWGAVRAYNTFYSGTPYRVVMPHGAADVTPGGDVTYRGVDVGVVRSARPLLEESADVRRDVHRTYHRKRARLEQFSPPQTKGRIWGLEDNDRDMQSDPYPAAGMAIVHILLRDPSVPIGDSSYAGGSAYYMTGQGYVTLNNQNPPSDGSPPQTIIPSMVEQFWQDRYLDVLLRFVPIIEGAARFQKKLENWYFGNARTGDGQTASGREQLRRVTTVLNEQKDVSDTLTSGVTAAGEPLDRLSSALASADRSIRSFSEALNSFDLTTASTASNCRRGRASPGQSSLKRMGRTVRSISDAVDGGVDGMFQRGLIEDVLR